MKYILGTKKQMTQIFDTEGRVTPVTAIQSGPVTVTQVKTLETDGYDAVQVGFGTRKAKNIAKPQLGHFKDLGNFAHVRENRISETELKVGDVINVSTFAEGDLVDAKAVSKAKGFQGVIKRHSFAGGNRTHGNKHHERAPGSIGAGGLQRVLKGMRMGGRMGGDNITVKNLKVVKIDTDANIIYVKGAVPGKPGTLIELLG